MMSRESLMLNFLYEIKQIRKGHRTYFILVTLVELLFLMHYYFDELIVQTDSTLFLILNGYNAYIIQNNTVFTVLTYVSCLFLIIIGVNVTFIHLKFNKIDDNDPSIMTSFFKKSLLFLAITYTIFQIVIVPTFVVIVNNISANSLINISTKSYIILPFLITIIKIDNEKKLLKDYLIIVGGMRLIQSNNLIVTIISGIIAIKLSFTERKSDFKKLIYVYMAYLCTLTFVMNYLNQRIILYYFLLNIILLAPVYLLSPITQKFVDNLDQNQFLLDFFREKSEDKISHVQKFVIINILNQFRSNILTKYIEKLTKQQKDTLQQLQHRFNIQKCLEFARIKMSVQSELQINNISLKIQSIYSKIIGKNFTMQILIEIFKLEQKIKATSTFQQRFELFELKTFVQRKYFKKEEQTNAIVIINFQKKKQTLYSCATGITVLLLKFWELKKKNCLSESVMFTIFQQMQDMETEIKMIFDDLDYNTGQERMIYGFLMKITNNTFKSQQTQINSSKFNKKIRNIGNSNYILVEQDKILGMSSQIRLQFSIKKQQVQNYRTQDIFPKTICEYITSRMGSLVQDNAPTDQSLQNIILPFMIPKQVQHMIPFRVSFKILPDIMNGIKYIIQFHDSYDVRKSPSFLYEANSDTILLTTKKISSYFSTLWKLQLSSQFAWEVFGIDLYENLKQKTENDLPFKCDVHTKSNMNKKQGLKIPTKKSIPIALKFIKKFTIREEILFLIQVFKKRDHDQQQQRRNSVNIQLQKFQQVQDNTILQAQKIKDVKDEFCSIENPYKNLINEKLIKLQNKNKFSYLKLILAMLIFISIVIFATNALLMVKVSNTASDLTNIFNTNSNKNKQITDIYVLLSRSAILHQIKNYPQHYLQITNYNIPNLVKEYTKKVAENIKLVSNLQMAYIPRQSINYKLQFNNFNLTTKTDLSNILDFVQDSQQFLVTDNLTFFVRNWPSISSIISSFETYNLNSIYELVTYQIKLCASAISIIIAAIFVINATCLKMKRIINRLFNLYEILSNEHCQLFIGKLNTFTRILYLCNNFAQNKVQKQISFENKEQQDKAQRSLHHLKQSMNVKFHQSLMKSMKVIQNNSYQNPIIQNTKGSIQRSSAWILIMKANFICFIPIVLGLLSMVFFNQIIQYEKQINEIMHYSDLLQNSSSFISYQASNFLIASLQQVLPLNERRVPTIEKNRQILASFESSLPSYFKDYKLNQTTILDYNLCSYSFLNSDSLYKNLPCQNILEGVMQNGFGPTISLYMDLIADNMGVQMKDFGSTYRVGAKFPVYMELYYIRKTVYNMLVYLQGIFSTLTFSYINIWNNNLKTSINYSWFVLFFIFSIQAFYYWKIHRKCRLALRSFYILPKYFLLHRKITKKLRNERILDQIQWLSF